MVDPKQNNNNHIVDDLKKELEEAEKEEIEEATEEPEEDEELTQQQIIDNAISKYRTNAKSDNMLKDKLMKIMFIIALVTICIIILLFIFSMINGGKKSYSDMEDVLVDAAKKYYSANSNLLPKTNKGTVEVSAQKLINLKYMKDFSKYKKGASCVGKVVVENNDDEYSYTAYINCGDDYTTSEIYRKVSDKANIVTTGDGVYRYGNEYVYRGENVNNYVLLNDDLWRIVKVTPDNETVLIKQEKTSYLTYTWDDRFNNEKGYNAGINDFEKSRIKDSLIALYNNEISNENNKKDDFVFTDNIKKHMVSHNYCIGKRSSVQNGTDNSVECSRLSEPLMVGLLTASEYMRASLDTNCNATVSKSCGNYNYLVNKSLDWWLITGASENTHEVYYASGYGALSANPTYGFNNMRPVIYLDSKTMYHSGNGTQDDPYVLK